VLPSKLLMKDCRVPYLRSSKKELNYYLHGRDQTYYDTNDKGFIIEDKEDETLEMRISK